MTEKRGSAYRNYYKNGEIKTPEHSVLKKIWQVTRLKRLDAVESVVQAAEKNGEVLIQPYQPMNSADIKRATQRATRLQAQAETMNTHAAWMAAAAAWRVAGDDVKARECERRAG